MAKRFFRLADDVYVPQRWHLDTPTDSQGQEVDYWLFKQGAPVHIPERLRIPVAIAGKPLDFTEANACGYTPHSLYRRAGVPDRTLDARGRSAAQSRSILFRA